MVSLVRTIFGFGLGTVAAWLFGLLERFHVGPNRGMRKATRRGFVRNAALGAIGVVTAQIGAGFVVFFWPNKTGAFGGNINVAAAQVPEPGASPFRNSQGKFYLVRNDDGVAALYWRCVHLGCTVPWIEDQQKFICPCHGSVYDLNGAYLAGPAPRALDRMQVTVDAATGNVTVDTGTFVERAKDWVYDPEKDVVSYPA